MREEKEETYWIKGKEEWNGRRYIKRMKTKENILLDETGRDETGRSNTKLSLFPLVGEVEK